MPLSVGTLQKMNSTELKTLEGKSVLIRPSSDAGNPAVGVRGTIHLAPPAADGAATLEILLEFPDMYQSPAHERIIVLRDDGIDRLLASEKNGVFEWEVLAPTVLD